jgi:L-arabinose isomerase
VSDLWLVTGSQHLYGPATLARVEEHGRGVAAALDGALSERGLPVGVRHRGPVASADEIRRVCLEATADDDCLGLIVWAHTFSPAKSWLRGLVALGKPLLHLHTQFNRELPWAEIDMDFMNLNQSAHGDRELAHALARADVRRTTVAGHWQDPAVLARLDTWTRAALGWHEAQRLRIARFGDNMRRVAVTEGDKVEAELRLGMAVDGYGVGELAAVVGDAADETVDELLRAYENEYEVAAELREDGERRASLREAARIEAGLRAFLEDGGFCAFTDTFEDLGALRQLPGIAAQRLMADGYGFGAEGDWKTAALVRIAKVMATGLPGGTSFMEDYTYDLTPGDEKVLGAHMLEVCPSIAGSRPRCEVHPLAIGSRDDPVRLVFTAHPGAAVVAALFDRGDGLRLLVNEVDVVEPDAPLLRLPVGHAVWRPRPSFAAAAEAWLTAGGPHHTVLSFPLGTEVWVDFATIAGLELTEVGRDG